jgi:hypothetical protein
VGKSIPFETFGRCLVAAGLLGVLLGSVAGLAEPEEMPRLAEDTDEPPPWYAKIQEKLEKRVSFDFVETPLADVMAWFRNEVNTSIVLDPQASPAANRPVTLKVQDMRLAAALDWIVRLCELTYVLQNEAVLVTTPDRAWGKPVLRIYDVGDLLVHGAQAPQESAPEEEDALVNEAGESLVDFLRDVVRPESWDKTGTSISCALGNLGVVQTLDVQQEVARALRTMRASCRLAISLEWMAASPAAEAWKKILPTLKGKAGRGEASLPLFLKPEQVEGLRTSLSFAEMEVFAMNKQMVWVEAGDLSIGARPAPSPDRQWVTLEISASFPGLDDEVAANGTDDEPENRPSLQGTFVLPPRQWSLVAAVGDTRAKRVHLLFVRLVVESLDERLARLEKAKE